jgi:hypothetical protein
MSKLAFDGLLSGVALTDGEWSFEGVSYDTPATELHVLNAANEAMQLPGPMQVENARALVFAPGETYLAQTLLAIADAYQGECADCDSTDQITRILQDAARRIACIEALTI